MSWGGVKTVENELVGYNDMRKEIGPEDYIMNIDADLVFVSDDILKQVLRSNADMIGQPIDLVFKACWDKSLQSTETRFQQGACYFLKASVVSRLLQAYSSHRSSIIKEVKDTCFVPDDAIPSDVTFSVIAQMASVTINYVDFFVPKDKSVIHMELTKDEHWKSFGGLLGIKDVGEHVVQKRQEVLIRRSGGLGDVLLLTPIIREFKKRFPNCVLHVRTQYSDVFANNPYVDKLNQSLPKNVIDLNGSYETLPDRHIIDAYALKVFGDTGLSDRRIELYPSFQSLVEIKEWYKNKIDSSKRTVVMHWKHSDYRKLPKSFIDSVTEKLIGSFNIVVVGMRDGDYCSDVEGVIDLRGSGMSIHHLNRLIEMADLYIGLDSGVSHVAASTNTPMLLYYDATNPEFRKPFSKTFIVLSPDGSCEYLPCYHEFNKYSQDNPVNFECPSVPKFKCKNVIDEERFFSAVDHLLNPAAKIVNIHRIDPDNIGDLHASPLRYFEIDNASILDICHCRDSKQLDGKHIIMGGGGLMGQEAFRSHIELILKSAPESIICWGSGSNIDGETKTILPGYLRDFALVGVRDYGTKYEWVPCPSCMNPLFDKEYKVTNEVVIYEHAFLGKINIDGIPKLRNSCRSIEQTLDFLGSADIVLTNTYHGAYWSTLLGKKVVVINPCSSRFYGFKHSVSFGTEDTWKQSVKGAVEHPQALRECRDANIQFAEKVKGIVSVQGL